MAHIDPNWWDCAVVDGRRLRDILAARDMGMVFRFLNQRGFSRSRIAALTGLSEARVRQVWNGTQQVSTYDVLERIAHGLRIPRGYLGLAYAEAGGCLETSTATEIAAGLTWQRDLRDTVKTVSDLWSADADRRHVVCQSAWVASALAGPTRDWLLEALEDQTAASGIRPVSHADVRVVWTMCQAFADADHRLGGGHARIALGQYVTASVMPLLGGSYLEAVGKDLMSATARMCNLGGFMAFDSGLHGLGLRFYIQALRLAQASRNRILGAHILADMSMQAHHLNDPQEAASLARAGTYTAWATPSKATVARCEAMYARALAKSGDRSGCEAAISRATTALESVHQDDEPAWISFFTIDQLDTEFAYAAADLGLYERVHQLAPRVIAASQHMERRKVLLSATLAKACLPSPNRKGHRQADLEQACAVLTEIAPLLSALTTHRGRCAVGAVRSQLRNHATVPAVRQLNEILGPSI